MRNRIPTQLSTPVLDEDGRVVEPPRSRQVTRETFQARAM